MSLMSTKMRTVRFHGYGEPSDVLRLDEVDAPIPVPGHIRIRVHACGLNPADWALCRGLFAGSLPRGIGIEGAGTVDGVGKGVADVKVGDLVLGPINFVNYPSAGASDYAMLSQWAPVPPGLTLVEAAALPLATETAYRSLENLGVQAGHTVLIHGAGTMVGFAAAQIALSRDAKVIATMGDTFAERLRAVGVIVTRYGDGMVERVQQIAGKAPDLILDTAPPNGVLPDLVKIAGGDAQRVLTVSDIAGAAKLGVRNGLKEKHVTPLYNILGRFARLAAERRFAIPVGRTFPLDNWREAVSISQSGKAQGKLQLLPGRA